MPRLIVALLSLAAALPGSALAGGDSAAGKSKSTVCSACHGVAGVSINPAWPSLAGQKRGYMVKQLKAFRDGSRANPTMSPLAKPLSDADIDDLAAYFAAEHDEPRPASNDRPENAAPGHQE
jgi:cytochrome c553